MKCIITNEDIDFSAGYYNTKEHPISDNGIELLLNDYISRWGESNAVPVWLYELTQRFKKNRVNLSKSLRHKIFKKCGSKCTICNSTENLQIDHIFPISKGGSNMPHNLQVLCRTCNIKKSNKINHG